MMTQFDDRLKPEPVKNGVRTKAELDVKKLCRGDRLAQEDLAPLGCDVIQTIAHQPQQRIGMVGNDTGDIPVFGSMLGWPYTTSVDNDWLELNHSIIGYGKCWPTNQGQTGVYSIGPST